MQVHYLVEGGFKDPPIHLLSQIPTSALFRKHASECKKIPRLGHPYPSKIPPTAQHNPQEHPDHQPLAQKKSCLKMQKMAPKLGHPYPRKIPKIKCNLEIHSPDHQPLSDKVPKKINSQKGQNRFPHHNPKTHTCSDHLTVLHCERLVFNAFPYTHQNFGNNNNKETKRTPNTYHV